MMLVRLQERNSSCISLIYKDLQNNPALTCPQMCPQFSGTLRFDCHDSDAQVRKATLAATLDYRAYRTPPRALKAAIHGSPAIHTTNLLCIIAQ